MQPHEVLVRLKALKLYGMVAGFEELVEGAIKQKASPYELIGNLLAAESGARQVRSITYQMTAAKFPVYRDLDSFDFSESPVNEGLIREWYGGRYLQDARNIVFVGGPGTGKSHLATALVVNAIKTHSKRVRFFNTVELVNALEQEKQAGRAGQLAARLVYTDAVVLDELGYLPFSQTGGALLFHLISKLYEKTSLMITTNLSF